MRDGELSEGEEQSVRVGRCLALLPLLPALAMSQLRYFISFPSSYRHQIMFFRLFSLD